MKQIKNKLGKTQAHLLLLTIYFQQQLFVSEQQPSAQQLLLQSPVLQPSLQHPSAQQVSLQQVSTLSICSVIIVLHIIKGYQVLKLISTFTTGFAIFFNYCFYNFSPVMDAVFKVALFRLQSI